MTEHPVPPESHPDLLGLLHGELDNAAAVSAGRHLEECVECRQELAAVAVGHCLLTRAARTLEDRGHLPAPVPGDLPALPVAGPRRLRRAAAWGLAAVLVVVGGTTATWSLLGHEPGPRPEPTATLASLAPLGTGSAADGAVTASPHGATTRLTVTTHQLPRTRTGDFYYAWLLDPRTEKMLPLGQMGPGGRASFEVPQALVRRYAAVDISLESDDGDPGHSVTSVLRGAYSTTAGS